MTDDDFRVEVLLNLGRALWQHVLPDLRGVTLRIEGPTGVPRVRCRFLYESAVGDLQSDCVWEAETELIADFHEGTAIEFVAVPHARRELEQDEEWVYLRWEPLVDE